MTVRMQSVVRAWCMGVVLGGLLWGEASHAQAPVRPLSRVVLRDGQELVGRVVAQDADHVSLELAAGQVLELPAASVASVHATDAQLDARDGVHWPDPNRTRYLYTPSAMMLKKGEGYFSQKELLFSSLAVGVSDHVTIIGGAALPLWFVGGVNFVLGAKVGFSPGESLHLAAGFEGVGVPAAGVGGFAFGSITLGQERAHLTLSGGALVTRFDDDAASAGPALFTVSGAVRVGPRLALVSENWVVPPLGRNPSPLRMANALAVRILGRRIAVDVGAVLLSEDLDLFPLPIPWLDFTYNFGG